MSEWVDGLVITSAVGAIATKPALAPSGFEMNRQRVTVTFTEVEPACEQVTWASYPWGKPLWVHPLGIPWSTWRLMWRRRRVFRQKARSSARPRDSLRSRGRASTNRPRPRSGSSSTPRPSLSPLSTHLPPSLPFSDLFSHVPVERELVVV